MIINYVRNWIKKSYLKKVRTIISIGEQSVLTDAFTLDIRFGTTKGRVIVGNNSMLSCRIIFESAEGSVFIGDRVFIGGSTIISRTKIEFGNDIFVAWGTVFYDHDSHSLDYREREKDFQKQMEDYKAKRNFIASKNWDVVKTRPIKICSNAWIGMNCIVLKGVTIGEGAIVGAGSVVTNNVPAWTIVAGNPAKVVKEIPLELRK